MDVTEQRFWAKVNKNGPVPPHRPDLGPCWLWTAAEVGQGYAGFRFNGRWGRAARYAYELHVGPIPEGLEVDHVCRVRLCVNPAHLEAVTHHENMLRGTSPSAKHAAKTHCDHGHEFAGVNLYVYPSGRRECRACRRDKQRGYKRAKRLVS